MDQLRDVLVKHNRSIIDPNSFGIRAWSAGFYLAKDDLPAFSAHVEELLQLTSLPSLSMHQSYLFRANFADPLAYFEFRRLYNEMYYGHIEALYAR
jgi:hypothetical protein